MKPVIGITMGDVAGIGPEIVVKALSEEWIYEICRPIVIGDIKVIEKALDVSKMSLDVKPVSDVANGEFKFGAIEIINLNNVDLRKVKAGQVSSAAGKAAVEYIEKAVSLALQHKIHAIVTAPINKEAINKAGYHFNGHTELLAHLTNTQEYAMMLIVGSLRVVHVTTHVSLIEAAKGVTKSRIFNVIKLVHDFLLSFGIDHPRIAVASLNPHAGEGGLFGVEEIKEIKPAVVAAKEEGYDVVGPVPADTVFVKAKGGAYDVVVAMYHDQGHIPIKLLGLEWNQQQGKWVSVGGINVTIGLPIIRSSVDHGTAYGKAWKGTANPQSLLEAIKFATKAGQHRISS